MKGKVHIYDTTLRDGTQGFGVDLTVQGKIAAAQALDELGIHTIEGGWPGSNPRDAAYFAAMRAIQLRHAQLAAFGSTARPGRRLADDENLQALLRAETPVVTIVGKTWYEQVRDGLRISGEENLDLIGSTIRYLKERGRTVVFDAEHFFDGCVEDGNYAFHCLTVARDAGADVLCLCDTRGGSLPPQIAEVVRSALRYKVAIGIHCHNDGELAVANTLAAVEAGASHVQGTMNGFGERTGNANLCSVIPNLQLKMGYRCISDEQLAHLTHVARVCAELANVNLPLALPYVGRLAFGHKGGLHVSAIARYGGKAYEHIDPALVGNQQQILISDLSGRSNVVHKASEFGLDVEGRGDELGALLTELKERENSGFQFEGAEASFELLMRARLRPWTRFFRLKGYRVIDEKGERGQEHHVVWAMVIVEGPDGVTLPTAGTGNGPVNALDDALRRALQPHYPAVAGMELLDYKVRVLENHQEGTGSRVRVVIESSDGEHRWGTVGVSHDVVEASWQALVDAVIYKLVKDQEGWSTAV